MVGNSIADAAAPDVGRTGTHTHLVDSVGKAILLDKRLGVAAEVGGHRRAIALGQESRYRTG